MVFSHVIGLTRDAKVVYVEVPIEKYQSLVDYMIKLKMLGRVNHVLLF